jgi:gamma-glutamyltranspeptidase/glutathione hydrolase
MRLIPRLIAALAAAGLSACATVPPPQPYASPPAAVAKREAFVIAANPLAAQAGLEVLKRKGSAVDASIAVQAMLSLVEPQSSGVGGGAFMTYYDARTGKVSILDGREVAPAQATSTMFLRPDGTPMPFGEAVLSGRATGVPGVVRMLAVAHEQRGKLPWDSLFADAERTARDGFIVSPRLAKLVRGDFPQNKAPDVVAYFSKPDGTLVQAGERLVNRPYADFMKRLAEQGPSALYSGSTAARIVERTRAGPLGGSMSMADLASYRPVRREALCRPYRVYVMCVPPPPSSGVGLIQLMKLLEHTDIAQRGPNDPQAWYLFAESSRIMYADRDRYVGDSPTVPVEGLLDPSYVASRARLIGPNAGPPPTAGSPPASQMTAVDSTLEPTGTSHFIVGDAEGNVVSMTTTVESIFGSGRMVDGFFLNNQMTDFAFKPVDEQGRPAVNAVAPGKRPRSSMTPTILLTPDNQFAGAIGSAGGNAILAYVAKSLVAAIDWSLPMQQAIAQPNLVARGPNFQGEVTRFSPEILAGLRARGIELKPGQGEDSGVHGVMIRNDRIDGGFDPRREGRVLTLPPQP